MDLDYEASKAVESMEFGDNEELAAVESRVSVASSEWGNVSSSSSSTDNELTAKDIVSWREFWSIWSSHHPIVYVDVGSIPSNHHLLQDIYSIFQHAVSIPAFRFHTYGIEHLNIPGALKHYLSHITQSNQESGLGLAAVALEVHQVALQLVNEANDASLDEQWAKQVHDVLIVQCAQGHLHDLSQIWSQPTAHPRPSGDSSPIAAQILSVRKIQPHGSLPIPPPDATTSLGQTFLATKPTLSAAVFSTRCQIASQLRDTPEAVALHSYSVMATRAALAQLATFNIGMPVFGVMFDRNIVRFHVDWSMVAQDSSVKHVSVSLPPTDSERLSLGQLPFRDFDLTQADEALQVTFILDAIHSYAQDRLTPIVHTTLDSREAFIPQGEISGEEKVQAWMQSGAVDIVGKSG